MVLNFGSLLWRSVIAWGPYLVKGIQLIHGRSTIPQSIEDINAVYFAHILCSVCCCDRQSNFFSFITHCASSSAAAARAGRLTHQPSSLPLDCDVEAYIWPAHACTDWIVLLLALLHVSAVGTSSLLVPSLLSLFLILFYLSFLDCWLKGYYKE